VKAFAKARDEVGKERNLWILKPSGSSQGRGIQVIHVLTFCNVCFGWWLTCAGVNGVPILSRF